jgi:2'-5' RNA ligase
MMENAGKDHIRAFFAIRLPQSLQDSLASLQKTLRQLFPDPTIRWSKPDHLHITLNFIPNLKIEHIPSLVNAVRQLVAQHPAFDLRFGPLELFPSKTKPRIISCQVLPTAELSLLNQQITQALLSHQYPDTELPFRPHLTLARLKHTLQADALDSLVSLNLASFVLKE